MALGDAAPRQATEDLAETLYARVVFGVVCRLAPAEGARSRTPPCAPPGGGRCCGRRRAFTPLIPSPLRPARTGSPAGRFVAGWVRWKGRAGGARPAAAAACRYVVEELRDPLPAAAGQGAAAKKGGTVVTTAFLISGAARPAAGGKVFSWRGPFRDRLDDGGGRGRARTPMAPPPPTTAVTGLLSATAQTCSWRPPALASATVEALRVVCSGGGGGVVASTTRLHAGRARSGADRRQPAA